MSRKLLLCLFLGFFLHCSVGYEKFYLVRKVPLPQSNSSSEVTHAKIRELRYLLHSELYPEQNSAALTSALQGDWNEARGLWEAMGLTHDCSILNNLGLAFTLAGDSEKSLGLLSRALAKCPENEKVRWNYRLELKFGPTITPYYVCPYCDEQ